MNEDFSLLKQLFCIHSKSGREGKIRKFIWNWVRQTVPDAKIECDKPGNLYVTKGKPETYPCIVAHMALWKISAKNSTNAPCKNKSQKIEKGMFVETSTASSTPPLGQTREHPMLAQLFKSKYGIEIDPSHMNRSYFDCVRMG